MPKGHPPLATCRRVVPSKTTRGKKLTKREQEFVEEHERLHALLLPGVATSPPSNTITTSDVGLALKEHLPRTEYEQGFWVDPGCQEIMSVDVTDPDNPVLTLENGQKFQLRIFTLPTE